MMVTARMSASYISQDYLARQVYGIRINIVPFVTRAKCNQMLYVYNARVIVPSKHFPPKTMFVRSEPYTQTLDFLERPAQNKHSGLWL